MIILLSNPFLHGFKTLFNSEKYIISYLNQSGHSVYISGIGLCNEYSAIKAGGSATIGLSNNFYINFHAPEYKNATMYFEQMIDFSKYSKIYIGLYYTGSETNAAGTFKIGTCVNVPTNDSSFSTTLKSISISGTAENRKTYEIDLSTLDFSSNPKQYLKIRITNTSDTVAAQIYGITLIP